MTRRDVIHSCADRTAGMMRAVPQAQETKSRASVMIRRCALTRKGTPNWRPIRNGTKTARGGLTVVGQFERPRCAGEQVQHSAKR